MGIIRGTADKIEYYDSIGNLKHVFDRTFQIGGQRYQLIEHAVEGIVERKVSLELVSETILKGVSKPGNIAGRTVYELGSAQSSTGRGITVVTENATKKVITVIDRGSKFIPD